MSSKSERNDRRSGKKPIPANPSSGPRERGQKPVAKGFSGRDDASRTPRSPDRGKADADNFLWGRHPVLAALANPARRGMGRLLATPERSAEIVPFEEAADVERLDEVVIGPDAEHHVAIDRVVDAESELGLQFESALLKNRLMFF